jgi:hypothetical protein
LCEVLKKRRLEERHKKRPDNDCGKCREEIKEQAK